MTLEELKAILLRPEAVRRLLRQLDVEFLTDVTCGGVADALRRALEAYADEAARTILQAQAGEQDERDAAVRALLVEVEGAGRFIDGGPCPCSLCKAAARVRKHYPEAT